MSTSGKLLGNTPNNFKISQLQVEIMPTRKLKQKGSVIFCQSLEQCIGESLASVAEQNSQESLASAAEPLMTLVMCALEVKRLKVLGRLANTSRREGVPQKDGGDDKL